MTDNRNPFRSRFVIAALIILFTTALGLAQCTNLTGFPKSACEALAMARAVKAQAAANVSQSAPARQTLTTGMADAILSDTLDPSVSPKAFASLFSLPRTNDGSFILQPGFYEASVESYYFDNQDNTLPRVGAYFPAPIKGRRAAIIASVLKQSELHPGISQLAVQQLISAIYAGISMEKMPPQTQQTAVVILPHDVARQLQASVQAKNFGKTVIEYLDKRAGGVTQAAPAPVVSPSQQQPLGITSEPVDAPQSDAPSPVARGTWTQMPGGFYVRYLPESCTQIRVQIMVPGLAPSLADPAHPLTFDPPQYLAVLAQAPGQRLGVTLRQVDALKH
jgi:hypothetical protein